MTRTSPSRSRCRELESEPALSGSLPTPKKQLEERVCPIQREWEDGHYNKVFVPKRKDQIYCSKRCQQAAANRRRKKRNASKDRTARIVELGGRCSVCKAAGRLWIYGGELLCGKHRSERNRQSFYRNKGWEPGKTGYERYRIRIFNISRAMQQFGSEKDAYDYIEQWFGDYPEHLKKKAYDVFHALKKDPNYLRQHLYRGTDGCGRPIFAESRSRVERKKKVRRASTKAIGGEPLT